MISSLLSFLYPPKCVLCAEPLTQESELCTDCFSRLHFMRGRICDACGYPLTEEPYTFEHRPLCASCVQKPPLYCLRSSLVYDDISKQLILKFKHSDALHLTPILSLMLYQGAMHALDDIDVLIPVPLSRKRLWRRRYNQSTHLAMGMAHLYHRYTKRHIPVRTQILIRTRHTPSQGSKSFDQRRSNVQGVFHIKNPHIFEGKRVALVDDVYTSGATMDACARVLKSCGVKSIYAFTLARVLTTRDEMRFLNDSHA